MTNTERKYTYGIMLVILNVYVIDIAKYIVCQNTMFLQFDRQ